MGVQVELGVGDKFLSHRSPLRRSSLYGALWRRRSSGLDGGLDRSVYDDAQPGEFDIDSDQPSRITLAGPSVALPLAQEGRNEGFGHVNA
jgi:hypothetical protein